METLATSNGPLSNYPMSNGVVVAPSPRISLIFQNQVIVDSGFIPPAQRQPNGRKDTFNNATDEDESYGSGDESDSSVSGD